MDPEADILGYKQVSIIDSEKRVFLIRYDSDIYPTIGLAVIKICPEVKRFDYEVKISKKVSLISKVFVKYYESKSEGNCYGIISEYCEGGSLKNSHLPQMSELQLLFHFKYLIKSLKDIHKNNIAHRDISSNNILMTEGLFKIADFGDSKEYVQMSIHTIIGTLNYIPPKMRQSLNNYEKIEVNPFLNDIWSM